MLRCNYIKSTGCNVLLFISVRNLYIVFTYSGSCRDARCQKSWAKLGLRCIGKPRPSVSKGFGKGMSGMPILDDQNMKVYDIEIFSENEVFSDKCRNIVAWTRAKWWEENRSISGYQHLFQGFCALSFECYSKITNINFKIVDSIRAGSSSHKFVGRKQLMALGNEFLNKKTKNNYTTRQHTTKMCGLIFRDLKTFHLLWHGRLFITSIKWKTFGTTTSLTCWVDPGKGSDLFYLFIFIVGFPSLKLKVRLFNRQEV